MEICIPNSLCTPSAGLPGSGHALLSGATFILFASIVFISAGNMPAFAAEPQVSRTTLERLTLESAEKLFSERNRELQTAKRSTEAAEADVISAGAPLNPSLSIGTSHFSPSKGVGSGRLLDKGLDTVVGISQVFERGNKRELRAEAAQFNADAARKDEANTARQQLQVLQAAYYDLLLAQDRLAIANTTATLFGESAEASDRRLRSGDIAATELARIQVEALKARNDARIARAERDRGQLALGYLIGTDREAARIVVADPWPIDVQRGKKPDSDKIIEQRTDISAAQARVNAAEKKRDLARSLLTRDITAGLQYERFPGDSANNTYGFTVSIPLFTRYQYSGEIRRAETELQAATENLERMRVIALGEINRAEIELTSAAERVTRLREMLMPAAKKAADGAEFVYKHGAIGIMDLLDARRQFYTAQLDTATALAEHARALAAWRSATFVAPDR